MEILYEEMGGSQSGSRNQRNNFSNATFPEIAMKSDPDKHNKNIETVISAMRSFSVIPVATTGVRRAELMQQEPDQSFRSFAAKVKGKVETCTFHISTKFTSCGLEVSRLHD